MARLDTIRALEKRGISTQLAEKTVELGYQLGTLKKCTLKELEKNFYYKEILQLIDVAKISSIDRDDIVDKALKEVDIELNEVLIVKFKLSLSFTISAFRLAISSASLFSSSFLVFDLIFK